jgi:aryl-alcohol dehydrogenase-like predicted oxidoreductase
MHHRQLGAAGPRVSALGLGCMALSGTDGPVDDAASLMTLYAALEAGITLLDTADFYGMGHNELLLRAALRGGWRERVFVSVKFGAQWGPDGVFLGVDARPASVKNFLSYTLRRLGTDHVDLYQPAIADPAIPIEDTVGAIADLVRQGYVRHIGLSEASAETIRRAHAVHPISALQTEYSLFSRHVEREIMPTLRKLGVALVACGVLSRGLLGGRAEDHGWAPADARQLYPQFQEANFARNLSIINALRVVAAAKGINVAQLAIAWVLSRGRDVITLVGARRRRQLTDAVKALEVELTAQDLARIDRAIPSEAVAGARYGAARMSLLDAERGHAPTGRAS